MPIIMGTAIVVALVTLIAIWLKDRIRDTELFNAEQLLVQAYSMKMSKRASEVEAHLLPAIVVAVKYSKHLWISESLCLLAESRAALGDFSGAIKALEVSMLHLPHWQSAKPAFAEFHRRKMSEISAMYNVLEEIESETTATPAKLSFEQIFAAELKEIAQSRRANLPT